MFHSVSRATEAWGSRKLSLTLTLAPPRPTGQDMSNAPIPALAGLQDIAGRYDALLCDVWGVLHNGREAFRDASDALVAYRRRGGVVILITNAPRPNPPIREQILQFGVAPEAFDAIVTSGDVTMGLIGERIGDPVHHIGPERDLTLFSAVERQTGTTPKLARLGDAAYVVCTGLVDDLTETLEDYDAALRHIAENKIPFICANPDLVVHRGDQLVYCAGALAKRLVEIDGDVFYCGKPHAPIYGATLKAAEHAAGRPLDKRRVLAVGDGMRTDIAGAVGQGLDTLFVVAGIHAEAARENGLDAFFAREKLWPTLTIETLKP